MLSQECTHEPKTGEIPLVRLELESEDHGRACFCLRCQRCLAVLAREWLPVPYRCEAD